MFSKPNPPGPVRNAGQPVQRDRIHRQAVYRGTLSFIEMPTPEKMAEHTKKRISPAAR